MMETDAERLLPCPFCGEAVELYPAYRGMGGGIPYAVDCVGCGIDITPREGRDAIAAWNRRTPGKAFDWERFFLRYIAPVCIAFGVIGLFLGIMGISQ